MNLSRVTLPLLFSSLLLASAAAVRADVWTPTSRPPKEVGGGREGHTAVWTGREMIVWGGFFGSNGVGHGGVYDPASDTWRPTSLQNLPATYLGGHTAVWAGEPVNRMLVYGGSHPPFGLDGGMYDPASDVWTVIDIDGEKEKGKPPKSPPANVPSFRAFHSAVWTGEEMIVWGGYCNGPCHRGDGAAYNPLTNSWRRIQTPSFLAPRKGHSAFWTGTEMIVWGGNDGKRPFNDGARYDPKRDEWKPISMAGGPSLRSKYSAVWTGREMIVWGGQETLVVNGLLTAGPQFLADGRIYDPALDRWRPMSTKGLPVNAKKQALGRESHTAVWTGEEMIVWGGHTPAGVLNMGHRYNPVADAWLTVTNNGAPTNRINHTAVWTGTAMVVWAGRGGGGLYGYAGPTGGVYRPTCGAFIVEPRDGDRVDRRVTFRLHASPAGATRQAMLFVDGVPHLGLWQPVGPDSTVAFTLLDELRGPHRLQVRTAAGVGRSECHSPEVPVVVGPTIKTLRLIYDPLFEGINGRTLRETFAARYEWTDPVAESEEFNKTMMVVSDQFAKYDVGENTITYKGYLPELGSYTPTAAQLFNTMANCGDRGDDYFEAGWQNLEGVPAAVLNNSTDTCNNTREIPAGADTVPNSGVPLGGKADEMVYAQSFKPWGAVLHKLQIGLSKTGSPTKRIKVSVRETPDGPDLWASYIQPAQVASETHLNPTRVPVAADTNNDGKDSDGDGKDKEAGAWAARGLINVPMKSDAVYYLVVRATSEELAARPVPEQPDPENHYWISTTLTEGTGRPVYTDAEARLYKGATEFPDSDMSVKLLYAHELDLKHLATAVSFDINGKSQSIAAHIREGVIDEVHLFRSPLHVTPESVMLGPRAFYVHAEPIAKGVDSDRAFVLMGFNYNSGITNMMESYGHRAEDIMTKIYGGWNNSPYYRGDLPTTLEMKTNWDRFTSISGTVGPGKLPSCGTVHHPPYMLTDRDYDYTQDDYTQSRPVKSLCEDWLTYPVHKGKVRTVAAATWGGGCGEGKDDHGCYHMGYLTWWYAHFPKANGSNKAGANPAGTNPDNKLNNWWRYIVEPDYYKQ